MAVTNYYTIDGQMIGYDDGSQKDFLTDALGSVTGEMSQAGGATFQGRYKPFGGDLTSSGTRGKYGWIGTWGYRETGLSGSSHYIRARHYSKTSASWTTQDQLWPGEAPYGYVKGRATRATDIFGMKPDFIGDNGKKLSKCCSKLKDLDTPGPTGSTLRDRIKKCMATGTSYADPFTDNSVLDYFINLLAGLCSSADGSPSVCVRGQGDIPKGCSRNDCKSDSNLWGYTLPPPDRHGKPPGIDTCGLEEFWDPSCPQLHEGSGGQPCSCSIIICDSTFVDYNEQSPCAVLFHEMGHCSGYGHKGGETSLPPGQKLDGRKLDFIYKLGCCMCTALNGKNGCGNECSYKVTTF